MSAIEDPIVNGRLFYYSGNEYHDPEFNEFVFHHLREKFDGVHWVQANGAILSCLYMIRNPEGLTIVHFHGNGECVKDFLEVLEIFAYLRLNVFLAEYRGYGMSTGKPSLSTLLSDIAPILESLNLSYEKVIVYGRSLGSLCAIHAVSVYPKIRGLIIEGGIADFSKWQGFADYVRSYDVNKWYLRKRILKEIEGNLNHKAILSLFRGSTLILHSQNDEVIPVSNANKLFDWANEPKFLKIFNEGSHTSLINDNIEEYCDELLNFVNTLEK